MGLLTEYDEPGMPSLRPVDAKDGWYEVAYGPAGHRHVLVFTADYKITGMTLFKYKGWWFLRVWVGGDLGPLYTFDFPVSKGTTPVLSYDEPAGTLVLGGAYIPIGLSKRTPKGTPIAFIPEGVVPAVPDPTALPPTVDPWGVAPKWDDLSIGGKKKSGFESLLDNLGRSGVNGRFEDLLSSLFSSGKADHGGRGKVSPTDPVDPGGGGRPTDRMEPTESRPEGTDRPDFGTGTGGGADAPFDPVAALNAALDEGPDEHYEYHVYDAQGNQVGVYHVNNKYPNPEDGSGEFSSDPIARWGQEQILRELAGMRSGIRSPRSDGTLDDGGFFHDPDVDYSFVDPLFDPVPNEGSVLVGRAGMDSGEGVVSSSPSGGGSTAGLRTTSVGNMAGPVLALNPENKDDSAPSVDVFGGPGGGPTGPIGPDPAAGGRGLSGGLSRMGTVVSAAGDRTGAFGTTHATAWAEGGSFPSGKGASL